MVTGGGSGGHITPILAVAAEIKKRDLANQIFYIGQVGDNLADIVKSDSNIDQVFSIFAGKFRRYHGEGIKQIFDLKTDLKNLRDLFYFLIGLIQSYLIFFKIKPDVLFSRGGYVGVPVALAARWHKIPYITHDSDSTPSLANKIIAGSAKYNAVALSSESYPYLKSKIVVTGIPVSNNFQFVNKELRIQYLKELNLSLDSKVLLVIGGGLGSVNINQAFIKIINSLLSREKKLIVVHVVGNNNELDMIAKYNNESILQPNFRDRIRVFGFIKDVYKYSGAADVIVSRAGATNIAEFAIQAKACIVIPSPVLANGHQLKNADYLDDHKAAIILNESALKTKPEMLYDAIINLFHDDDLRHLLEQNILKEAQPKATNQLVNLILKSVDV